MGTTTKYFIMSIGCHAIASSRFSALRKRRSGVNGRRSREEPGREITEDYRHLTHFCSSRTLYSSLRAIAIGSKGYTSIKIFGFSQGTNTDYSAYSKSNVGNPAALCARVNVIRSRILPEKLVGDVRHASQNPSYDPLVRDLWELLHQRIYHLTKTRCPIYDTLRLAQLP